MINPKSISPGQPTWQCRLWCSRLSAERLAEPPGCHHTGGARSHGSGVVRTCTAPSATLSKGLWYSSDAIVIYDIEGGGKGARRGS
jgi:hypothetical protein